MISLLGNTVNFYTTRLYNKCSHKIPFIIINIQRYAHTHTLTLTSPIKHAMAMAATRTRAICSFKCEDGRTRNCTRLCIWDESHRLTTFVHRIILLIDLGVDDSGMLEIAAVRMRRRSHLQNLFQVTIVVPDKRSTQLKLIMMQSYSCWIYTERLSLFQFYCIFP